MIGWFKKKVPEPHPAPKRQDAAVRDRLAVMVNRQLVDMGHTPETGKDLVLHYVYGQNEVCAVITTKTGVWVTEAGYCKHIKRYFRVDRKWED